MKKYDAQIETEVFPIHIDRDDTITLNGITQDAQLEAIDDHGLYSLRLGSKTYDAYVQASDNTYEITVEGQAFTVRITDQDAVRTRGQQQSGASDDQSLAETESEGAVKSPMTGVLIEVLVNEGDTVESGDGVAILEAMKTENVIRASSSGTVREIQATVGQAMRMDDIIMYIDDSTT